MSMDKETVNKYLQMFKVALAIVVIAVVAAVALLLITIPKITGYTSNTKKYQEVKTTYEQKQVELAKIKDDIAREEAEKLPDSEMRVFYKDIQNTGSITSDVLSGEVQEINELIKYYGIKIYKVNYTYDDENDTFRKGKPEKYNSCRMDLELFSNYMKFQGFMKDLYKHQHFLDIHTVEVVPYKKDKSILNIKLTLNIYAENDNVSSKPTLPKIKPDETTEENSENGSGSSGSSGSGESGGGMPTANDFEVEI